MVYKPKAFQAPEPSDVAALMQKYPFANLITYFEGRMEVTHLPFILEADEGPRGTLYLHLARSNPHCKALDSGAECLVVFNGPASYISPSWYEPDAEDHIPTWNYAVVHAHGRAKRIDDPKRVFWQMDQIHRAHDKGPLTSVSDEEKAKMIPHVMLFRIPIDRCESVFKLNQNRSLEDAEGAMQALASSGDTVKTELGDLMRKSIRFRKGE